MTRKRSGPSVAILAVTVFLAAPPLASGYGTFTHQELIDLAWYDSIRPLLLQHYPGTAESGLREAHASPTAVAPFRISDTFRSENSSSVTSPITCAVVTLFYPFCGTLRT